MSDHTKRLAKFAGRILVTTGLLVWVFRQVDIEQFKQAIRSAQWQYVVAAWVFTAGFFLIQSVAMQMILKKQSCEVSIVTLFGASAVTSLYSMVLPGILSTGAKWYILKRSTGKGTNVLSSMVYNQCALFVTMISIGLTATIVANPLVVLPEKSGTHIFASVVSAALLMLVILGCVLLLNIRTGGWGMRLVRSMLRILPGRIQVRSEEITDQITVFQTAGAGFHLKIAVVTLAAGLLVCGPAYASAARAAVIDVPVGLLVWLCASVYVLGRLPVSIANLGVRESVLVGLLSMYGVEKSTALLMSMILFSALVFMALIGVGYQIVWSLRRPD